MKKIIGLVLAAVMVICTNLVVVAGTVDVNKMDKVVIKCLLDDGTVQSQELINTDPSSNLMEKAVKYAISCFWGTDYNVKEVLSINDIPLKDTQFSQYAGVIDKSIKGQAYSNTPSTIERVEENESKSIKDTIKFSEKISIKINGIPVKFDVAPYIKDGRTMVPFRAIFEALGAEVSYDFTNTNSKVLWGIRTINGEKIRVDMKIGSKTAVKTGTGSITMDVSPEIKESRTFIPARFASELLGATVDWKADTREVVITLK